MRRDGRRRRARRHGRSSRTSSRRRPICTRGSAASSRRSRRARTSSRCRSSSTRRCATRASALRDLDAVAATRGPGPDRRAPRRLRDGQGDGGGARRPVLRRAPHRGTHLRERPRPTTPSSRRSSRSSCPADTRRSSPSASSAPTSCSARRWTTPPARRSTRSRGSSASATRAVRRSTGSSQARQRRSRRVPAGAAPRRPRLQLLGPEDRGRPPRPASRGGGGEADALGRRGLVPGGDRRRPGREDAAGRRGARDRPRSSIGGRRRRQLAAAAPAWGPRRRSAGSRSASPTPRLCVDNGAMIAAAGHFRLRRGEATPLDASADASLPSLIPGRPLSLAPYSAQRGRRRPTPSLQAHPSAWGARDRCSWTRLACGLACGPRGEAPPRAASSALRPLNPRTRRPRRARVSHLTRWHSHG